MKLEVGQDAPKIDGVDFSQKMTLVYFYPADFTGGCTEEACSFRDNFSELTKKVHIVGVSGDSAESHDKFKAEYKLPFELIADPDKHIINAYGANGIIFTKRVSFLVGTNGKIAHIFNNVDPKTHAAEVLATLP